MELCICVMADVIHFLKIIVVSRVFFLFQKRTVRYDRLMFIIALLVAGALSAIVYVYDNDIIETCMYVITTVILMFILHSEKIHNIFIATLWILFALSMVDAMIFILFDICMQLLNIDYAIISNLLVSIMSFGIIVILGRIYKKNNNTTIQEIGYSNLFSLTILLAVDMFVVGVIKTQPFISSYLTGKEKMYMVALVLVIIGIFIQLAAVIILFAQRNIHKEKEQISNAYLNEQKNHYEYLENREKETKKFRHDLRSHMELISSLVKNNEYEQIEDYIKQMNLKIDTFGNIVTVQNGIVDAIINQYYTKAEQSGIKMEVKGMFPVDCAIETFDLCTIFSNALSNAYEATTDADEKYISLECGYTDKNIIVIVRNTFNIELADNGLGQKTTKKNKDLHGFGLENIKDSVAKYNGYFDIEKNDNIFILKIMFNYVGK